MARVRGASRFFRKTFGKAGRRSFRRKVKRNWKKWLGNTILNGSSILASLWSKSKGLIDDLFSPKGQRELTEKENKLNNREKYNNLTTEFHEINKLNKSKSRTQEDITFNENRLSNLNTQKSNIQNSNKELLNKRTSLEDDLLKLKNNRLEAEKSNNEDDYIKYNKLITNKENEIRNINISIDENKAQLLEVLNSIAVLNSKISRSKVKLDDINTKLLESQSEVFDKTKGSEAIVDKKFSNINKKSNLLLAGLSLLPLLFQSLGSKLSDLLTGSDDSDDSNEDDKVDAKGNPISNNSSSNNSGDNEPIEVGDVEQGITFHDSWGAISDKGLKFLLGTEGWSDGNANKGLGKLGTRAKSIKRGNTSIVGPGLTSAINGNPGVVKIEPDKEYEPAVLYNNLRTLLNVYTTKLNKLGATVDRYGQGGMDALLYLYHWKPAVAIAAAKHTSNAQELATYIRNNVDMSAEGPGSVDVINALVAISSGNEITGSQRYDAYSGKNEEINNIVSGLKPSGGPTPYDSTSGNKATGIKTTDDTEYPTYDSDPNTINVVSQYGHRAVPENSNIPTDHTGIDINYGPNEVVRAFHEGEVTEVNENGPTSNIKLKTHDGHEYTYMHVKPRVKVGTKINKGDEIAAINSVDENEYKYQPHLHLETRTPEGLLTDPIRLLNKDRFTVKDITSNKILVETEYNKDGLIDTSNSDLSESSSITDSLAEIMKLTVVGNAQIAARKSKVTTVNVIPEEVPTYTDRFKTTRL